MPEILPALFTQRLKKIVPEDNFDEILRLFSFDRPVTARINTLKTSRDEVFQILGKEQIPFLEVPWSPLALILPGLAPKTCGEMDLFKNGFFYRQSLSSMLPAIILDPLAGESVLDFCAAPGSKTTQMAALMKNEGEIIAVEAIRSRFFKLKSVCELMGAVRVSVKLTDGRRFRTRGLFDKILVDAPCSSEGRFKTFDPKSLGYWSPRKIKEMAHKQKGLLLAAGRLLKPGGVLVYSTCTFAPEENEAVLDWFLDKTAGTFHIEPCCLGGVASYPCLSGWSGGDFHPQIKGALRVLPDRLCEGFFVAKLIKTSVGE